MKKNATLKSPARFASCPLYKGGAHSVRGFTLIELLLVIALISILTVAGLAAYQLQVKNFRIDKTALQMQQWLQAGMAFYVDCGQWPDPNKDPNVMAEMMGEQEISVQACPRLTAPVQHAYIPAGADKNGPWPNRYAIGVGTGIYAGLFEVETYLPAFLQSTFTWWVPAINVAWGIAGRLPNAIGQIDRTRNPPQAYVRAYIGIPGSVSNNAGQVTITDMQIIQSCAQGDTDCMKSRNSHIVMPKDCPAGTHAVVLNALTNFESGTAAGQEMGAYSSYTTLDKIDNKVYAPNVHVRGACGAFTCNGDYSSDALLIAACLPDSSGSKNGTLPSSGLARY